MFINISQASHAQIIVAPVHASRLERMADGRVIKQPTGALVQFTAITYDIETSTAGQLVIPVPPGAKLLSCEYHDLMQDIVRLFPELHAAQQPSAAARKFCHAEIRPEIDRYVRLPDVPLERGQSWHYIIVDIEPDVQPAPIFYTHPIIGHQLLVPTAISATGIVRYEREVVSRDVNDRVTQMLTRRQPTHVRPYAAVPNWTVYIINAGRIRHDRSLRDAGCSLHAADTIGKFYECVNGRELPRAIVLGEARSAYRLTAPIDKEHNEYLLI